jgi:hypothetical protein
MINACLTVAGVIAALVVAASIVDPVPTRLLASQAKTFVQARTAAAGYIE